MTNMGKGPVGTNKTLICLWLVMLLLLSSEKMGSEGCKGHDSQTWDGNMCVKHGTCNVVCQREGYDRGRCYVTVCMCYKNCVALPI
ncbi:hypothetical protein CFC21_037726 [Triticum aestivum]|uniref:Knottins-like domain-containing protein n=3 Tax=Triticum TaxID=4564 RepID=A0A9R1JQ45_WHEAT|nr:hypothetical protein TRIUR3_02321 [Triticum urartu]KAF7025555.1 hypothetical protein CFC21_037726 [Triticum aestivum]